MSDARPGMLDRREPMTPRVRVALMAVIGLSFCAAVGAVIFSDRLSQPASAGADSYSESAVGHKALRELLGKLEIPVLVSRIHSGQTAGADHALLMLAEPPGPGAIADAIEGADVVLLVLPKRDGARDPEHPEWVDSTWFKSPAEVEQVLGAFVDGEVDRRDAIDPFAGPLAAGQPDTALPLQIFRSSDNRLEPLIVSDRGDLLAAHLSTTLRDVYILSDPDLIANHGLHRGDNALLVVDLIDHIRARHDLDAVVIDETVHGHSVEESIWQSLFELPIAAATFQAVLALLFGLWAAGAGRFGPPVDPPGYASGTEQLVENSAQLLASGGHDGYALRRYLAMSERAVADRLHTEPDRLDAISKRRSTETLEQLRAEVEALADLKRPQQRRVLALSARIHTWKEDMIHGASGG